MPPDENFKIYLFEYRHDDSQWGFEIQAASQADAEERVAKLQFATYRGEIAAKIPVLPGSNAFVRALCWMRNVGATWL